MLIGIAGLIGSGKDTVAEYLITNKGFRRMSFAEPLKDAVSAIFGWDRNLLEGTTIESREWRDQVDEWWATRLNIRHLTPRWVLQQWGTEVGRRAFHDDIWIASIENKLRSITDNIVISDCRFPNEIKAIKQAGGKTIRVSRGSPPIWYQQALAVNKGFYGPNYRDSLRILEDIHNVHASEYSSIGLDYDYHIDNSSTLEDLYKKIDSIIDL